MLGDDLKVLKQKSGLTTQQIADMSGIPASTISRILSGQTDNPSYYTVSEMVRVMGGSLDRLSGVTPEPPKRNDGYRQDYEKIITGKDKWILRLFILCVIFCFIFIFLLTVDLLNPGVGFIQFY